MLKPRAGDYSNENTFTRLLQPFLQSSEEGIRLSNILFADINGDKQNQ